MEETMEIPLTRGQVAIIDVEDWYLIKDYKWFAYWCPSKKGYYAMTHIPDGKGSYSNTGMHRLIMDAKKGEIVDHINGHGLNNTRNNLRIVTARENAINQKLRINNTSGKMGVTFDKERNNWRVRIHIEGKRITIGRFDNFQDAVAARKAAEDEYYGEFARRTEPVIEEYVAPPEKRDISLLLWYLIGYGEVYIVPLTQNQYSIIDLESYHKIADVCWAFGSGGYAIGYVDGAHILMQRHLTNPSEGQVVDHINGDKIDNRISNLRCVTPQQNSWNSRAKNYAISERKGVHMTNSGSFEVRLRINGKPTYIGRYPTLEEAIEVRNAAYRKYHGDFARYD